MTGPGPKWRRNSGAGYPLGQPVLVLRSVASRADVELGATLHDARGRQVGSVRTTTTGGWKAVAQFLGAGASATWDFVIARADGTPYLYVRRPRVRGWHDRHERFELRDAGGRDIGRLLQDNGYLAGVRTFSLQSGQAELGRTTFAGDTVTVGDAAGRTVATVSERPGPARLIGNDLYDYTLTFDYPPAETMGALCLVVALSGYFYRRTERGGSLRWIPRS